MLHGNVVSKLAEEFEIGYKAEEQDGGWCIFINSIIAIIGYTDFDIQIDKSYSPESCEFSMVKDHEYEHIRAHLSVIDDEQDDIKDFIRGAANNIFPIFVSKESEIDGAMDKIQDDLQSQPQLVLMRKKLNAEQEIRNKKIDLNDKGERLKMCER